MIETLREQMLFPCRNLPADVPFSTRGPISCRNNPGTSRPQVREHFIELFHFALKPTGYLFLGCDDANLENVGLFEPESERWHLYWRCRAGGGGMHAPDLPPASLARTQASAARATGLSGAFDELAQRVLVEASVPPSVLIIHRDEFLWF